MADLPLVYFAGPYSNPDPVENTHKAIMLADAALNDGVVTPLLPHLTHTWHLVAPRPYEDWLEYDLRIMRRCDAVYRFPGASSGADAEVAEAERLGIPIFTTLPDLYEWAGAR